MQIAACPKGIMVVIPFSQQSPLQVVVVVLLITNRLEMVDLEVVDLMEHSEEMERLVKVIRAEIRTMVMVVAQHGVAVVVAQVAQVPIQPETRVVQVV